MLLSRFGGKSEGAVIGGVLVGISPERILVSDVTHKPKLPEVQAL
jgi:hypothetical protein